MLRLGFELRSALTCRSSGRAKACFAPFSPPLTSTLGNSSEFVSHNHYHPMPNANGTASVEAEAKPGAVVAVQVVAVAVSLALALQLVLGFVGVHYVYGGVPDFAVSSLAIEALRRVGAIALFVWLAIALRRPSRPGRLTGIACISLFCIYCVRVWLTAPVDVQLATSIAIVAALVSAGAYWLYAFGFSHPAKRFFDVHH